MPATEEVTVRVELPDPLELRVTIDGLGEAVRPEGRTEVASVTVPAKPLTLPSWIEEVPEAPLWMVRDVEPEEMVKSTTFTITCTEWERDPMVPVMVTLYVPTVPELRVSVDEAVPPGLRLTLVGLTEAVRPLGDTDVERLIMPVKPAILLRLIVVADELPD